MSTSINLEDTLSGLRDDFIAQVDTKTSGLEESISNFLSSDSGDIEPLVLTLMREAHNLKGSGGTFGFPILSVIAHRLEDYITESGGNFNRDSCEDILRYLDVIQDSLEFTSSTSDEIIDNTLRSLPSAASGRKAKDVQSDIEALIISPSKTVSAMSRQFLGKFGVRVVGTRSPTEVLILAIRSRPDLVIVSMVMEEISGVDIARALNSMVPTQNTTVVLLTSLSPSHQELSHLPDTVSVLRQDQSYSTKLEQMVSDIRDKKLS